MSFVDGSAIVTGSLSSSLYFLSSEAVSVSHCASALSGAVSKLALFCVCWSGCFISCKWKAEYLWHGWKAGMVSVSPQVVCSMASVMGLVAT